MNRNQQGLLITVIGPDGSGKTTIMNRLARDLRKNRRVHEIHWRPAWLPHIGELFGKEVTSDPSYTDFTPHKAPPSGFFGSLLRLFYYTIDFTLGFFIKIRPYLKNSDIVLFDRYYYDFIVDPRRSRIKLPKVIPTFLLRLVPPPDFVFFLDNDPHVLLQRKQELPLKELFRQLKMYRDLIPEIKNSFVIPAGSSIEQSVEMMLSTIEKAGTHPDLLQ